jgi:hypothetical protein
MLRASAEPRPLDDIVEEAVAVIEHRRPVRLSADARELFRTRMKDRIRREQGRLPMKRVAPTLDDLENYLGTLRAARTAARPFRSSTRGSGVFSNSPGSFPSLLDNEINHLEFAIAQLRSLPRQPGSKPLDARKYSAVRAAADLLNPSVERCRAHLSLFPDDPRQIAHYQRIYGDLGGDCPWRQRLTGYPGGAWNKLACLIYEALTGEATHDLTYYCRHFNAPRHSNLTP